MEYSNIIELTLKFITNSSGAISGSVIDKNHFQ